MSYKTTIVIMLVCNIAFGVLWILAVRKIDDLRMRNNFLKAVNDALRLYIKDGKPKGVHRYTVPFGDDGTRSWPPYMDLPRNPCAGCVHEHTNEGSFPCDECKRSLRGEHDMYIEKVKE